jgi:hypothetical protein
MSIDVSVESGGEEILLYFEISSEGLDAQTFGNALILFDDLYRGISRVLNPGVDVEVEFIRSDHGSIRAILRSLKKDSKTLLGAPFLHLVFPFLIGLLVNQLSSSSDNIVVTDDSYIVEHGR